MKDRPPSDEHIFPLAIGGSLHTQRVCRECNSILGSTVDAPLSDHIFIVIRRAELGLKGNSNTIPDALKNLLGTGMSTLVSDPTQRVQLTTNPNTGKLDLKMIYHATETKLGGEVVQRQITLDARDVGQVGTIIQRERKRAGHQPLSLEELKAQVDLVVAAGSRTIEKPEVKHQIILDRVEFRKGLLKIAYELAFIWLGETYLDDPMAARLRDVILSRSDEQTAKLRGGITIGPDSPPVKFWFSEKDCHIAYSSKAEKEIAICVKIFDIFTAVVIVTEQMERYLQGELEERTIQFIRLDPVSETFKQTSLARELDRLGKSGVNIPDLAS
ncbi:HNH endonuclease [Candidatus Binatus sp.]|uniref:HNH endonuclease n=1 Tax=Candidatus Binatus sp. TaxID=2811406 RepID=UPI003BD22E4C